MSEYEKISSNFYIKIFNLNRKNFKYKHQIKSIGDFVNSNDFDLVEISEDNRIAFKCSDFYELELETKILIFLNNLYINECTLDSSQLINYFFEIEEKIGDTYEMRKFLNNSNCFDCRLFY